MKVFFCGLFWYLITVASLLAMAVAVEEADDQCASKKPHACIINPDSNASHVLYPIEKALIYVSPQHIIAYSGEDAVFRVVIESKNGTITLLAYVDGCKVDSSVCQLMEYGSRKERICTFSNVNSMDDGKEVQFYGYMTGGAQMCYNDPPSSLIVIGPPKNIVTVSHSVDRCSGISIYINSSNITHQSLRIVLEHLSKDVYSLNFSNVTSSSLSVVIPPEILSNHTGTYSIKVIPFNPAGNGPQTTVTVNLSHSHLLEFTVESVSVEMDCMLYAGIIIKVNESCPLSIPNHLHLSSSCSSVEVDYMINATSIVNNLMLAKLPLPLYKHNCTVHVKDYSGKIRNFQLNNGTFHTRSVVILENQPLSNMLSVGCSFVKGSRADGCWVEVLNEIVIVAEKLYPTNYFGYAEIGPLMSGTYVVSIYDVVDGVKHGPLYQERVNIVTTTSSEALCTSSHFGTLPSCVCDEKCLGKSRGESCTTLIIVLVLLGAIALILLTIVLCMCGCLYKRKKVYNLSHGGEQEVGNRIVETIPSLDIKPEDQKPSDDKSKSAGRQSSSGSQIPKTVSWSPDSNSSVQQPLVDPVQNLMIGHDKEVDNPLNAKQTSLDLQVEQIELKEKKTDDIELLTAEVDSKQHPAEFMLKQKESLDISKQDDIKVQTVPSKKPTRKRPPDLQLFYKDGQKNAMLHPQESNDDEVNLFDPPISEDSVNTGGKGSQIVTTPTPTSPRVFNLPLAENSISAAISCGPDSNTKSDSTGGIDESSSLLHHTN